MYFLYWSNITLERFYSLNATVYDLGSSMEVMWLIYNAHWTVNSFLYTFFIQGGKFILLPLVIPQSFQVLLIAQTFYIGAAVFAIYGISMHFVRRQIPSILISFSYLIFFVSSGLNWFDFHFQVLFIPLFLFAYYCYIKRRFGISMVLFILSGLVRFPLIIFPSLFSLFVFAEQFYNFKFKKRDYSPKLIRFATVLLSLGILCLAASYYSITFSGTGTVVNHLPINNSSFFDVHTLFNNLDNKIFTLLLLFAPVIGFPLMSRKWFLFLLPSIYLILFSPFYIWTYPYLFQLQYTAPLIPFLFLGTIDTLASLTHPSEVIQINEVEHISGWRAIDKRKEIKPLKITALIFILITLFGSVYLPYGPMNGHVAMNYGLSAHTDVNWTRYDDLESMIKLIPRNDARVIVQGNIPQAFPRPVLNNPANPNLLVAGFNVPQNFTIQDQKGKWISVAPDYVLADPYNNWLYTSLGPYNFSMYNIVHELYASKGYGILAEASGMILLKKNFNGPEEYYIPFSGNYPASTFSSFGPSSRLENGIIVVNSNPYYAWYGPDVPISPGKYVVNYEMKVTNNSRDNSMDLNVVSDANGNIINHYITGNNFTAVNHWTNISTTIYVNNTYASLQFRGIDTHWIGTIYFRGVTVDEISPPSTVFMAEYNSNNP